MKRSGTVALVVKVDESHLVLLEALSDDNEISVLESALTEGQGDPLEKVHQMRDQIKQEDEEFGNYVEELLSRPFVKPEIQNHAVQWLKSKIKIEEYQKSESEATKVIAEYAMKIYQDDNSRTDFYLAGPQAKVRIRIFKIPEEIKKVDPEGGVAA